jgi:hypothetical protein
MKVFLHLPLSLSLLLNGLMVLHRKLHSQSDLSFSFLSPTTTKEVSFLSEKKTQAKGGKDKVFTLGIRRRLKKKRKEE